MSTGVIAQGLSMGLLALLAVAVITRPWWRRAPTSVAARRDANVAAYRDRLDELKTEQDVGLVDAADAEPLQRELAARLLADAGEPPAPSAPMVVAGSRRVAVIIAAALLVFAALGYGVAGSWRAQREIASTPAAGNAAAAPVDPQVEAMIAKLAERMQAEPDNVEGWALLGRSYFATGRYAEAAKAFAEASQRHEAKGEASNPDWLVGEGEALAFADGQRIPPAAAALFERALKLAPQDGKALWYGGMTAAQDGRLAVARQRWTALATQPDLPPAMQSVVRERLAALAGGAAPAADTATGTASRDSPAVPAGPGVSLSVQVSLAPALAGRVLAGATLFVFAKAASGPPMPLAVQRLPAATLPMTLTLDDSMAMAPQLKLSQFDRYVVTARLSASGGAQPLPGDLEGSVELRKADAGKPVTLVIDHVRP